MENRKKLAATKQEGRRGKCVLKNTEQNSFHSNNMEILQHSKLSCVEPQQQCSICHHLEKQVLCMHQMSATATNRNVFNTQIFTCVAESDQTS